MSVVRKKALMSWSDIFEHVRENCGNGQIRGNQLVHTSGNLLVCTSVYHFIITISISNDYLQFYTFLRQNISRGANRHVSQLKHQQKISSAKTRRIIAAFEGVTFRSVTCGTTTIPIGSCVSDPFFSNFCFYCFVLRNLSTNKMRQTKRSYHRNWTPAARRTDLDSSFDRDKYGKKLPPKSKTSAPTFTRMRSARYSTGSVGDIQAL